MLNKLIWVGTFLFATQRILTHVVSPTAAIPRAHPQMTEEATALNYTHLLCKDRNYTESATHPEPELGAPPGLGSLF